MLPRIQPFSLLGGAVMARDLADFPAGQRDALLERFEAHLAEIDSRVRCVTENQAFHPGPAREPRFEGAVANCDAAVDLAGEARILFLTREPGQAVAGAWGLSGIQILVGPPNYEIEAVPSPSLPKQGPGGAQIWGQPNTLQWSRVVQDIMQEFFDITIQLDGSETLKVVQWKVPARVKGIIGTPQPEHDGWYHGTGPAFDIMPHTQAGHLVFKKA